MPGVKGRSGGMRSGAGRKASAARVLNLRSRDQVTEPMVSAVAVAMPDGLGPTVSLVWAEYAPHALRAGTLTPSTASAFLRLCQSIVSYDQMQAVIGTDGLTYLKYTADPSGTEHAEVKAHPLIGKAAALQMLIRAWLKDFLVHPFGKPMPESVQKPEDPFAKFGATG